MTSPRNNALCITIKSFHVVIVSALSLIGLARLQIMRPIPGLQDMVDPISKSGIRACCDQDFQERAIRRGVDDMSPTRTQSRHDDLRIRAAGLPTRAVDAGEGTSEQRFDDRSYELLFGRNVMLAPFDKSARSATRLIDVFGVTEFDKARDRRLPDRLLCLQAFRSCFLRPRTSTTKLRTATTAILKAIRIDFFIGTNLSSVKLEGNWQESAAPPSGPGRFSVVRDLVVIAQRLGGSNAAHTRARGIAKDLSTGDRRRDQPARQ